MQAAQATASQPTQPSLPGCEPVGAGSGCLTVEELNNLLMALEGSPPAWPGRRLGEWYEAIQAHPAVSAVMAEARPATAEWVRRKVAAEPFDDGWWRPEEYGRQRNICFPKQ